MKFFAIFDQDMTQTIYGNYLGILGVMEMERSRERFGNGKPLWKQRRGHLLWFPDHKATEKEN